MKWFALTQSLLAVVVAFAPRMCLSAEPALDFNRDVRPILANHCWNCHGQDEGSRKASLRLDSRAAAMSKTVSDEHAIVPG